MLRCEGPLSQKVQAQQAPPKPALSQYQEEQALGVARAEVKKRRREQRQDQERASKRLKMLRNPWLYSGTQCPILKTHQVKITDFITLAPQRRKEPQDHQRASKPTIYKNHSILEFFKAGGIQPATVGHEDASNKLSDEPSRGPNQGTVELIASPSGSRGRSNINAYNNVLSLCDILKVTTPGKETVEHCHVEPNQPAVQAHTYQDLPAQ